MSWERDTRDAKYESIQHGYEVQFDEDESDVVELSLDALLENEIEELEIEEIY
jgi:hypothetical protein